jgi:hypothetical protein
MTTALIAARKDFANLLPMTPLLRRAFHAQSDAYLVLVRQALGHDRLGGAVLAGVNPLARAAEPELEVERQANPAAGLYVAVHEAVRPLEYALGLAVARGRGSPSRPPAGRTAGDRIGPAPAAAVDRPSQSHTTSAPTKVRE